MGDTPTTPPVPPSGATPPATPPAGMPGVPADPAGGAAPPAPEKIIAKKGQFFCEFAAEKGFRNCEKWRAKNPPLADKATLEEGDEIIVPEKEEGETADQDKAKVESVRVDYPPAKIRFLGQTTTMGDRTQAGLTRLGISNYITDKAGFNDNGHTKEFFTEYGADDVAGRNADPEEVATWNDPDHFRIEVHDVTAGKQGLAEVEVELQVLQPLYKRVPEAGKTLVKRDEESRPDPNAPKGFRLPGNTDRRLIVICKRVGDTNYYRSKYLRLVTEAGDKIADHTLFVGDYYQDPMVGAAAPDSALGATAGHGPTAGGIAGGAVVGAVVGGGAAAAAVMLTENKLSDKEKGAIIGGAAVGGAVVGGLIGGAASSEEGTPAPEDEGTATAMTAEQTEDTRRYAEILDQKVRARYIPAMCTDKKCRTEALAEVGELKNEMRMAVHILDGCCSEEDVRRVVYGQVRRVYASTGLRPHLKKIYKHGILEHIILLGSQAGTGAKARGNTGVAGGGGAAPPASKLTFKVDGVELTHSFSANQTVSSVAGAVKSKLEAHRKDGNQVFWTRVVKRETEGALAAGEEGSHYVLVFKDADHTQFSKVERVSSDDVDFSAGNPSLDSAALGSVPHDSSHHSHVLIKASCRTEWFDGIILKDFDNTGDSILFGIATWLFKKKMFPPAFLVHSPRMVETPNDARYTFAHEMGHVLMNCGHCIDPEFGEQLMIKGQHATGNAFDMPGRRRIMDAPMKVDYQVAKANGTWVQPNADGTATIDGSSADLATATARCHQFMPGALDSFGGPTDREPGTEW